MGSPILSRLRAAGIWAWAGGEQVAHAGRRGQRQPVWWRLHKSNFKVTSCGSREEARRDLTRRRDLSDSKQPVLALRSSLYFLSTRHADAAAVGKDHFPLSSQS